MKTRIPLHTYIHTHTHIHGLIWSLVLFSIVHILNPVEYRNITRSLHQECYWQTVDSCNTGCGLRSERVYEQPVDTVREVGVGKAWVVSPTPPHPSPRGSLAWLPWRPDSQSSYATTVPPLCKPNKCVQWAEHSSCTSIKANSILLLSN